MKKFNKFIATVENIIVNIFTSKYLYYTLGIIAIVVYYNNCLKNSLKINDITNDNYKIYYFILLGILAIAMVAIYFVIKNKKLEIYKKYFIVAIILSSFYVFTPPMFTQSDETFHYIRAYQIAEGRIISKYNKRGKGYDYLPESIKQTIFDDDDRFPEYKNYSDIKNEINIDLNKSVKSKTYIHCASYVFLDYVPAIIGMKAGIILNLSPYIIGVLGRLTSMIICTLIFALGIKRLPYAKKTMTLLLLCPVILAYTSSISADSVINSVSFLFIATILNYIKNKTKLNYKNYIELILMIIIISVCKTAYLPIIFLILLLPHTAFKDKKTKYLSSILLVFLGIISSITWMKLGGISIESSVGNHNFIETIIIYFNKLINTIFNEGLSYIQNIFAGDYLYQRQVNPAGILSIAYLFIFIFSYLSEETNINIEKKYKVFAFIVASLIFLLVMYALYASAQKNKTMFINGVQGRYFIPIMMILPIFMGKKKLNIKHEDIFTYVSLAVNISVILTIYVSFAL